MVERRCRRGAQSSAAGGSRPSSCACCRSRSGAVAGWQRRARRRRADPPRAAPPPPPKPFRIIFPGGLHAREMAERVTAVDEIARRKRNGTCARGSAPRICARRAASVRSAASGASRSATSRASSSRRRTTSCKQTTSKQLVADSSTTFWRELAQGRPPLRREEEPDAVRRADDRVDDREGGAGVRASGKLVAAVIYNRLHREMTLGIDATMRYGLHVPPTESLTQSQLDELEPVQHAAPHGPAADADRQPGPRLDRGGGASGEGRLPLLRPQAGSRAPLLHGERRSSSRTTSRRTATADRRRDALVALLGHPVAHSLSPRMQNAAFAARGLDWTYVALDVAPERLEAAVRGLAALGFVGRERDGAAQARGRRRCATRPTPSR